MQGFPLRLLLCLPLTVLLVQCNPLVSDCEAIALRNQEIYKEAPGDYFIGRRYFVPTTRFWGYIRRPQQEWKQAKLVMMDESLTLNPDRGPEKPLAGATYGKDDNAEYIIRGSFLAHKTYDPNSNQVLPTFRASSFTLSKKDGGFLFKPSEERRSDSVSLQPAITPSSVQCSAAGIQLPRKAQ